MLGCCVGWRWCFGELGLLCGHVALPWKRRESPALEAASQAAAGGNRTSGNHVEAADGGNVVRGKHVNCSVSL